VGSSGAGKSALLADWLAAHPERPSAWLNCDPADDDAVRFVAAIIEATRRAGDRSELGEDALQLLSLDGEVSPDVIAALLDDLDKPDGAQVLVIDDLHLAGGTGAETLGLLLQYQPRSLRLVVACRVDPSLRLHRMRANDELIELRDRDLCFSADEAKVFLSGFGV
jgi:LuxR family maltose regulon positive regulatory protein